MSKQAKRDRQRQNREARRQAEIAAAKRRQRLKWVRNGAIVVVPLALLLGYFQLTNDDSSKKKAIPDTWVTFSTNLGDIVVKLDPEEAPKNVEAFIDYVNSGFYNNLTFYRASTATGVVQAGDNDPAAGPAPGTVKDELPASPYKIGDVALANAGPDTADTEFFIVSSTAGVSLPQTYTRIGVVVAGLDIVQLIEGLAPANGDGPPTQTVTIASALVTNEDPVPPTTTAPAGSTTSSATTTTVEAAPPAS